MKKQVVELRIVEATHPSGNICGIFFLGKHEIGRAEKEPGGWKPFGKRKVLPPVQAAKAMIDSMISKANRDLDHARSLLNDLRLHNGGSLPPKI